MSRYLTAGNLLVEDVVLPDGRVVRNRLGGDALYAAIGARAFADDVELVVRLGRSFPEELTAALERSGYGAGLIPCRAPGDPPLGRVGRRGAHALHVPGRLGHLR